VHFSPYCEIDLPDGEERLQAAFADPDEVFIANESGDVPAMLARVESFARGGGWAVGYVAYEAASGFDSALKSRDSVAGLPAAIFAGFRKSITPPRVRGPWLSGIWRDISTPERFDEGVSSILAGIAAGDYYQINYTTRLRAAFAGDSLGFFDALRASQPAAFCTYLDFGRWQICSVSPELFFQWHDDDSAGQGRTLQCRPMKGTAARSDDPGADRAGAVHLRDSPKERAENLMIVDLIRNDLSKLARLGSVAVPQLFTVEAWPTVWQMTSTVTSRTRPGVRLADVFAALFPCGSVTGAPKVAAMAKIASLEEAPRGEYCGAIGIVKPGGAAQFSVGIRTVVVDRERGTAECGVGSGIVWDSKAPAEYAEWQSKRAFLDRACPPYELFETLRLRRGRYALLQGHLGRLQRSAQALGFSFDAERVRSALQGAADANLAGSWRVRLRLGADGKIQVDVAALDAQGKSVRIGLAAKPVDSSDPWLRHKTTRRGIYDTLASTLPGVFDTLLHNQRGELTEFTRGNLVVSIDGVLVTPPVDCGLLPGVYRGVLLARGRIVERIVRQEDLARAQGVWFVNSVRGAIAVSVA
jgi:para-aminobenzoate synthetase / 4-amino-4-deoxychorismate lyase